MKYNNYDNNCDNTTVVVGNSVDVNLNDDVLCQSSEIRSDVVVEEYSAKRIWGQVVNCDGMPVANSLVKLVKVVCDKNGNTIYQGIAHTITNCEGFYQFDVCADDIGCYKVLVNKATTGMEAIMMNGGGNCNLCSSPDGCGGSSDNSSPCCQPQQQVVVNNTNSCSCNGNHNRVPNCGNKKVMSKSVNNCAICR